jgi:tRNA (adenine22-N1)-methyltransferase
MPERNVPFPNASRKTSRFPKPDVRLRAAADWVTNCDVCADIGCDHGRFGATLLAENRCKLLLAADISAPALDKARARLTTLGLSERTVFALADGLDALDALPNGHADTVCILGMGGDTIAGILLRGASRLKGATLVLGAQTELSLARTAIQRIGYRLTDERVVNAGGRMYLLMRAACAPQDAPEYTERELSLGPCLLQTLPEEWLPWLTRKHRLLCEAVAAMNASPREQNADRLATAQRELDYTNDALHALSRKKGVSL